MNFSRALNSAEYVFLVFFLLVYLIYFIRVFGAARKLKTTATSSVFKFIVRALYLGLISLALLGPNFGVTEMEARASGKDIILAFDLSESMNCNDVSPSRLDKAKIEGLGLVDRFKSDRIGLVAFNSESYLLTPLTFDQENVKATIQSLSVGMLPQGSTDFNPVYSVFNDKLGFSSQNRAKVGVLITDGESHYAYSRTLVKSLIEKKISVFFMAVGTLGGGKIPKMGGYKKDKEGEEVVTSLDISSISQNAKALNGQYYILNNHQNDVPKLVDKMSLVVGSSDDLKLQTVTYNKFVFFLLLALVFIALDFLITLKVLKI